MKYFSYITMAYAYKNNLCKAVHEFLKEKNRRVIEGDKIEAFKKSILEGIDELNKEHPRCHPIQAHWWKPGVEEKNDYVLSMRDGMPCTFHIYASQN